MAGKNGSLDPRLNWATLSQAERDAAYDNNSAVNNSAALIAERNQASEALRASRNSFLDIPYGDRERTKIDLYPADRQSGPLPSLPARRLLAAQFARRICHAGRRRRGAWLVGCHSRILAGPRRIADPDRGGDIPVARLAGQNGEAYGISGPVVLSGWSAGAHLVAMALDHPRVAAGLAISGVYDLAPIRDTGLNNALKLTDQEVAAFRRFDCRSSTSGSTSPTARPNCRRWSSIRSSFMKRAWPPARPAGFSRSRAQTISASWRTAAS